MVTSHVIPAKAGLQGHRASRFALDPRLRGGDDNPFAHLPIYGLEDLGFVLRGEAGHFIAEHNTAPGGELPLNTNGGGLSYMHSGTYALQESVRQMRVTAPAQIPDSKISVCYGVGGMFAASGTIIMSNEAP
jgi:acetyl-CoA acetyltransferase